MGSSAEPFPRIVRWGLLAPLAVFAIVYLLAVFTRGGQGPDTILIPIALVAALIVELLAVPMAIFLMVRDGRYASLANFAMTTAAALPLVLVLFVVLVLRYGHFHI